MDTKKYVITYYLIIIAVFVLLFYFKTVKPKGYSLWQPQAGELSRQQQAPLIPRQDFNRQNEELRIKQEDISRQQQDLKRDFDDFRRQQQDLKRQQDEMANFTSRQVDIYKATHTLP